MHLRLPTLLLALVLFLAGCITGDKVRNLRPNMTTAEVEKIMGRPDGFEVAGKQTAYTYAGRLMSGWSWDKADYVLLFEDGKLIKYGPGNIRPREMVSNTLNIVWVRI